MSPTRRLLLYSLLASVLAGLVGWRLDAIGLDGDFLVAGLLGFSAGMLVAYDTVRP